MSARPNSFTLIELLVVIGIVAILSVAVLLALNPTQLMAQGRDATRLNDLDTLQHALSLYQVEQSSFGSSTVVYVSVPDTTLAPGATSTCSGIGLNSANLPAGWTYQCVSSQNLQKVDGTGWIPVNFGLITAKNPLSQLPIDSINTTSSGSYYTYVTNGSQWELTAIGESQKYRFQSNSKTAFQPGLFVQGTNLNLSPIFSQNGLVGYWNLDESTGTVAYNGSGNGNNGTWSGTPVGDNGTYYTTGKVGPAGDFEGSTDKITVSNASNQIIPSGNTAFTLAAWVNAAQFTSGNGNTIITNENYLVSGFRFASDYNGNHHLSFWSTQGGGTLNLMQTSSTALLNTWYHVAVSYTGSSGTLYINGQPNISAAGTVISNTNNVVIGGGIMIPWNGIIDDVRIYNRALSAAEIQAIYNATK